MIDLGLTFITCRPSGRGRRGWSRSRNGTQRPSRPPSRSRTARSHPLRRIPVSSHSVCTMPRRENVCCVETNDIDLMYLLAFTQSSTCMTQSQLSLFNDRALWLHPATSPLRTPLELVPSPHPCMVKTNWWRL